MKALVLKAVLGLVKSSLGKSASWELIKSMPPMPTEATAQRERSVLILEEREGRESLNSKEKSWPR